MPDSLRASSKVSLAILASRLLGLARESVFAALIGAGAFADAYQVAFRIPNLLRDLLAEGALSSAFVPTFTSTLQAEGQAEAYRLGNLVLGAVMVTTGALTLLGMVFAEPLVIAMTEGFGGDADKVALTVDLTRIMMPILALVSAGAVWMGMLNAQRHFVVPAVAPALFNFVSITVGLVVWLVPDDLAGAVMVWSMGTLVAGVVQALVQAVALWRLGYRPFIRLRGVFRHRGVRRIAKLMAPAVIGVAAVQLSVFVNTRFASGLGDGPVAQLAYAFRLFFLPLGMFGVALATVTTTSVSEAAATGDRRVLSRATADGLEGGLLLVSASAVGLLVLADPVVTLIYRYGMTDASDAAAIALCLRAYVVGLLPYSLVKILAPAFYAIDRPRIPLLASALGVAVNIGFNAPTHEQLGAPGIALGTALGAIANFVVLRVAYAKVVARFEGVRRWRALAKLLAANLVLAAILIPAHLGWARLEPWHRQWSPMVRVAVLAGMLLAIIALGFCGFAFALKVLGHPGGQRLLELPRGVWRRVLARRS